VPFPNPTTQWKPGKSARPADCPTISKQRARRLAREAVIAEEITKITKQAPDFHGDAHDYLRGVYDGSVKPDPLRMQAAAQALKYEKPALAAVAIAQKGERTLIDLLALAGGNNASAPAIPDASADNLSAQPTAEPHTSPPVIDSVAEPAHNSAHNPEREKLLSLRARAVAKGRQNVVDEIDEMLKELGA
jgi:hypothetical protein